MSGFFNVNNNASSIMNGIFNSLGNSSQSGLSGMLGDYYSIQNGSYYKMAKKLYAGKPVSHATSTDRVEQKPTGVIAKQSTETMKAAGNAVNSLAGLMDKKLYDKISIEAEDGTKSENYNQKEIFDRLESFVKDYNQLVDKAGESSNRQTLENGVRMLNQTKVYANSLQSVGISIGDDNTLKLDEEAFAKADMADVQSLFTGSVSFAKNTQSRMLALYSAESMSRTSVNGLYNAQAMNQISVGSMFDRMF